jgi:hypothetical protein
MEGSLEYQMEEGVKRADFVLVLGSARYKERAETPGSGVACEVQRIFIHFSLFILTYTGQQKYQISNKTEYDVILHYSLFTSCNSCNGR